LDKDILQDIFSISLIVQDLERCGKKNARKAIVKILEATRVAGADLSEQFSLQSLIYVTVG
jgi:hypothetical protein